MTASGLLALVVLGAIYLHSLPKPAALQAESNSPLATTPVALATKVTAPAASIVLELADVQEILPGDGWTQPSGGPLVNLSAVSTATSTFAYGPGAPVQIESQVCCPSEIDTSLVEG